MTTNSTLIRFALIGLLLFFPGTFFKSEAQSNTPACVSNLVPCASFMSSTTKPPQTCCGPLKIAVTTQLECLCGLYNTPGLLESFKVNLTQALHLPALCDIDGANLSQCSKVGGSAPSPTGSGTSTLSGSKGKDDNGAGNINGISPSVLIFAVSLVALMFC